MTNPNAVRNPRYAGATIGGLVRALMRPMKPKDEKPAKGKQPDPQEGQSGVRQK